MRHDPLELAEENYTFQLRRALEAVEEGDATSETLATIAFSYRVLGIRALLRHLDAEQFAKLLRKSGLARRQLLRQATLENPAPPRVLAVSHDVGFCAALAAGDLDTATGIAERSPDTYVDGWEHEEDFLFFHFLQQLLHAPDDTAALHRTLKRWTRVVEGEPTVYITVCQTLMDADEAAFSMALEELIETRKESLRKYRRQLDFDQELDATEGKVYINGLALVRMAQSRAGARALRVERLVGAVAAEQLLHVLARLLESDVLNPQSNSACGSAYHLRSTAPDPAEPGAHPGLDERARDGRVAEEPPRPAGSGRAG